MISVSVAMATYNGQKFVREQLDSLAAQQHLPSELIITDDASSDKTVAIVQQFRTAAPFPVHLHQHEKRVGYRANFMRAAHHCISEVIAFCDQDDIWSPRKLALCVQPFRDPAVLLTYHNAEVVTEAGARIGRLDNFSSLPMAPPLSLCPIRKMGAHRVSQKCFGVRYWSFRTYGKYLEILTIWRSRWRMINGCSL
jgi:glycosyltransferase involved in cell wall biosynthesis